MIVAFFGHSKFLSAKEYEQKIIDYLEERVGDQEADMYLGGYGDFDNFAYACCKKFKETHPNVSLLFITPYITEKYQKSRLEYEKEKYDGILYPEIENKPLKFAIFYRNKWMVEKADYIIFGVCLSTGGAYKAYQYAKKVNKECFNVMGR